MTFRGKWSVVMGAGACALLVMLGSSAVGLKDGGAVVTAPPEVLYAPEDKPADRLVGLYRGARHAIYIATYGLTYPPVVKALVAAKKRGVDVRVITDRGKLDDRHQLAALETLRLAGVPIKINRHDGLMHMKQVVVDDQVNTSGSMNQTSSAAFYNDERLDILRDAASTQRAKDKFLKMWADHVRYEDWR
jgi:phosphatidylserine/phosphatidylglycerophosphate/cardiolipin synthase-like enzyme